MASIHDRHERSVRQGKPRNPLATGVRCDTCGCLLGDRHSDGSVTLRDCPVCEGGAR